jgi:tRNA(fMet)-specific endonuclease VapC
MKRVALDTNVAVDLLNGDETVLARLKQYDMIYLPVTVSGELLFGAKNSKNREINLENFRKFISSCEELAVNNLVAEEYSDIRLALKKKGRPIPENDVWIAAICIANDLEFLTRDSHFSSIEGLKLARIV